MLSKPHKTRSNSAEKFQNLVLSWFDQHGRKNLPWQQNKTPYRVWVSEIMLQQTQVSTAIPYFERFLQRFPTINQLAKATEDEVLHLWTGLGYYNRARNLHKTAKIIAASHSGQFPATQLLLENLPGIGRSTAGAILAIAFEKKAAILDGNVKRVLTRLHAITEWPGEKKTTETLWKMAEKYTPSHRVADYTQAMMDIGATLCVRGTPRCTECPFQKTCKAHQLGIAKTLPKKKVSVKIPTRQITLLIFVLNNQYVLLEKRPSSGIWGGLWSLPETAYTQSTDSLRKAARALIKRPIDKIRLGEQFRHTFSHFHLEIQPALISLKPSRGKIMEADQQIWYNLLQPDTVGLPAPVKTLLMGLNK
ncbi:MAG: A/G-specific adenine glycosylase [Gammaproteobacteria bacterium]|nr:A/G-specific adenine glycosylase [Gammaproteobacteria bacterium]